MKRYMAAVLALMLLCGCTSAQEQTAEYTKLVKITQITPQNTGESISLSGNVVPVTQAAVSFKLAGVIDEVYVSEGDSIKKGDKIASLKSSDYKLQADAAQAQSAGAQAQTDTAQAGIAGAQAQADAALSQVKTAQAALDAAIAERDTAQLQIDTEIPSKISQAKEQLDLTQKSYDNITKLYEGGVATKNQLDEITTKLNVDKETYTQALDAKTVAESKLKAAQAQIEAAQATKQAAQSSYDAAIAQVNAAKSTTDAARSQHSAALSQQQAAQNSLADTVIYSPVDGVVLKKVMNSGETVAAGTPIAVVGTTDKMWVRVGVPDNYINKVHKGQTAVIHVYGTNSTINGTVDEVGALADTTTRTFTVNILADNTSGTLKSGMICTADIVNDSRETVLVPVDSVISMPEDDYVFIYNDESGTVSKVSVETGEITGDKIEVTGGLSQGDKLVTEGQFVLADGESVSAEVNDND